jgi:hypothetical protein
MNRRRVLGALLGGWVTAVVSAAAPSASTQAVGIGVRPTIVRYAEKPEIYGEVTPARAGEPVTVQFKQCGLYPVQFRDFMTTQTNTGGGWSLDELLSVGLQIPASGTFRALANGETSREVELKMRAFVALQRLPRGRGFYVRVAGVQSFWRRQVRIERFDTRLRKWTLVRSLLLTESEGTRDYNQPILVAETESFHPRVPKRTMLRAVLPLAAAKPCYLGGYSLLQRA